MCVTTYSLNGGAMKAPEVTFVTTPTVACDGSGVEPGHPRVFLTLTEKGVVVCPYCSRRFELAQGVKIAASH